MQILHWKIQYIELGSRMLNVVFTRELQSIPLSSHVDYEEAFFGLKKDVEKLFFNYFFAYYYE